MASGEADAPLPRQIAAEVRDATNAILAEAEAAVRTVLAATADMRRDPATETFLWARLTRLSGAADEAVSAAHSGHARVLRSRLRRFEALTSAIWTVQHAVYGQVPLPAPAVPAPVPPVRPASPAVRREAREGTYPVPRQRRPTAGDQGSPARKG